MRIRQQKYNNTAHKQTQDWSALAFAERKNKLC